MTTPTMVHTPGADLAADKMPGHWLLARMGKRVLRPGGLALTTAVLEQLSISGADDVVELAPGMGITAQLVLDRNPATYTGVERDADAAATVRELLRADRDRCMEGPAQHTGLDDESADVVLGEAFLTMQSSENKRLIIAEAFRVLRPGGRYGLHEMCLRPDGLDDAAQDEVRGDLSRSIHIGARPLTVADWRAELEHAGFEIRFESTADMALLEPRRLVHDEGWRGALRLLANVMRDPTARRRVRAMRASFRHHRQHLGALALVAVKPAALSGRSA